MAKVQVKHYIRGQEVEAHRDSVENVSPADKREVVTTYAPAGAHDLHLAVGAAVEARPELARMSPLTRGQALFAASRSLREKADSLANLLTREVGKTLIESQAEITRAAEALEFSAGQASRLAGETLPSERPRRLALTLREPLGVVAALTPFNYPAQIAAWKIGPAIAAGCPVVLKASELAPGISHQVAMAVGEAIKEQGGPAGAVNTLLGDAAVGKDLVGQAALAGISFTGGTAAGASIRAAAAERGLPLLCETGGKNPLVVLSDADLFQAVEAVVKGGFGNAGQRCTGTSRVVVVRDVAARFNEELGTRAMGIVVGPGLDPMSEVGPLISEKAVTAVETAVKNAVAKGAKVVCGGERLTKGALSHGNFYKPTVLTGVLPNAPIAQEELFGPVVVVLEAKDEDEALSIANSTRFGLSASVFTKDLDRALRFVRGLEAGIVHVNSATVGGETQVPFAGMKATGNGPRERGSASVDFFTRWKTVYLG